MMYDVQSGQSSLTGKDMMRPTNIVVHHLVNIQGMTSQLFPDLFTATALLICALHLSCPVPLIAHCSEPSPCNDDICIPHLTGYRCGCPVGWRISQDRQDCESGETRVPLIDLGEVVMVSFLSNVSVIWGGFLCTSISIPFASFYRAERMTADPALFKALFI